VIELSLHEVAGAVAGTVVGADPAAVVSGPVVIDSRAVEAGSLFVAVAGTRVDGHDYAAAAVGSGAVAVLADRPVHAPHVLVADTTLALGALAGSVRGRLDRVRVVGLTGSQGKTSTKDLLGQLLGGAGPVVAPAGSLNNELGVPLTVLRTDRDTAHLVVEMGARGADHIRYLCDIARPDVGVVLNVGTAHVGEFGSRAAIARVKGELVEALPPDGVAVLNADDPLVLALRARTRARVLTFGEDLAADVRVEGLHVDTGGRPRFTLRAAEGSAPVAMRVLGGHQALNAAAAATAALALGLSLPTVAEGLSSAEALSSWRMERTVSPAGVVVVNDAYNASPDAMRAALRTLAVLGGGPGAARTVAVLGEMRELGDSTEAEHVAVGRLAAQLQVDLLVVVGAQAQALQRGARLEPGWTGRQVLVADAGAATDYLRGRLGPGDVVLVKASRAAGLERVAAALVADPAVDGPGAGARDTDTTGDAETDQIAERAPRR